MPSAANTSYTTFVLVVSAFRINFTNLFIAQQIAPLSHQDQTLQGGFCQSRKPKGCEVKRKAGC